MNFLEIQFSLRGKTLPADHGYLLYSAVKKNIFKGQSLPPNVLLSSIPGVPNREGIIYLKNSSKLRLRCPAQEVQTWYRSLQNVVLDIQGHLIRLVQPRITLPEPSTVLKARLVTFNLKSIDNRELPFYFLESCQKSLTKLDINAQVFIDSDTKGDLARRAIKIKEKEIVGYGVVVEQLSNDDSLKLQCLGLGGRKHFGCGWFYPTQEVQDAA